MKFKKGDKVRVTSDIEDEIGLETTIDEVDKDCSENLKYRLGYTRYSDSHLELVSGLKPESRLLQIEDEIARLNKEKSDLGKETATSFVDSDDYSFETEKVGDTVHLTSGETTLEFNIEDRDNLVRIIDNAIAKSE